MNSECLFCEIIKGNILSKVIYEDENTLAFLDKSNDVYGHTLIIPKKHICNLMDCDQIILNQTIATLKKVANFYTSQCGFSGINILNGNGISAEQSVPHLHFHLIPRVDEDEYTAWPNLPRNDRNLEREHEKLKILEK